MFSSLGHLVAINAVDAREAAAATALVILYNMLGRCGWPLLSNSGLAFLENTLAREVQQRLGSASWAGALRRVQAVLNWEARATSVASVLAADMA